MSTDLTGIRSIPSIHQSASIKSISVKFNAKDPYVILTSALDWMKLVAIVDKHRSKKIKTCFGRKMNIRLHIGALIAQARGGWTDRETEDMVRNHAGVRYLCGTLESCETIDHTSISDFRNSLGVDGMSDLNKEVIGIASAHGFITSRSCAADTTVQEAPIAYPTEVNHMKNIARKIVSTASGLCKKITKKICTLGEEVVDVYGKIRLFTNGKKEEVLEQKKILTQKLHSITSEMVQILEEQVDGMKSSMKEKTVKNINLYKTILNQIMTWITTGKHPTEKIVSLWNTLARSITRNKAGKTTEFGVQWLIARLSRGYIIGAKCQKTSGNDGDIIPQILKMFRYIFGEKPEIVIYDRGGDSAKNHQALKKEKIENGIFIKGPTGINTKKFKKKLVRIRKARSLNEASIGVIKGRRLNFSKPRARSAFSCELKGHSSILGANLNHLVADMINPKNLEQWAY